MPLQIDASKTVTNITTKFLDAFVDSVFEFVCFHPRCGKWSASFFFYLSVLSNPSLYMLISSVLQSNFAPVDEIGEATRITNILGKIPEGFPVGVYIRNGPTYVLWFFFSMWMVN